MGFRITDSAFYSVFEKNKLLNIAAKLQEFLVVFLVEKHLNGDADFTFKFTVILSYGYRCILGIIVYRREYSWVPSGMDNSHNENCIETHVNLHEISYKTRLILIFLF